ncbi:hypothetical protein JF780_05615 [Mycobacterium intracellulare]|uniref:DUF6197 family protein n=1 Tax=Mycobacterium intracellulare TaxID=1767 RepID=UPI001CDA529F|nr:hypothetical protein [Mycobacterium intracellulare]MCA2275469.1 hypothetical protein [Mycobacterium intracellulare]MCA2324429.1 hypothetical protein [Mycobacterium intracellulare]
MKNLLYVAPALVPPDPVEIIEALEDARTLVGPHLPKGNAVEIMGNWGCLCIVAAITAASRTKQIRDAAMATARYALPGRFHGHSVEEYNDHPATTVDDAKTLLQRAKGLVGTVAA